MMAIIAISKQGTALAAKLKEQHPSAHAFTLERWQQPGIEALPCSLGEFCKKAFATYDELVFIMATGIVVRSIAPYIHSKTTDPAVVVMDDRGEHVIALLSGHLGGANALAHKLAQATGGTPVITTASDVNDVPAVDLLAKDHHLVIASMEQAKQITAMLVNREHVELMDTHRLIQPNPLPIVDGPLAGKIIVSNKRIIDESLPFAQLIPRNLILGIGCRKGVDAHQMHRFVHAQLCLLNLHPSSVATLASIDIKCNEAAILQLADTLGVQIKFYSKDELATVDIPLKTSAFVTKTVGTGSVSAASAHLAGEGNGQFIAEKIIHEGMTLSIFQTT